MTKKRITARSQQVQQQYDHDLAVESKQHSGKMPCPFCYLGSREKVEQTATMVVLSNQYPYEYFDGRWVQQHYMIVPRRHLNRFSQFTQEEQQEYWSLLAQYQQAGYVSLTRADGDERRSVPLHLHTHLITYKD